MAYLFSNETFRQITVSFLFWSSVTFHYLLTGFAVHNTFYLRTFLRKRGSYQMPYRIALGGTQGIISIRYHAALDEMISYVGDFRIIFL